LNNANKYLKTELKILNNIMLKNFPVYNSV